MLAYNAILEVDSDKKMKRDKPFIADIIVKISNSENNNPIIFSISFYLLGLTILFIDIVG